MYGCFAAAAGLLSLCRCFRSIRLCSLCLLCYLTERAFISQLAETDSFVIIGRAANSILADHPNTLRLFIYASEEFKLPRVKAQFNLQDDHEARKIMHKTDKERKEYFEYYSDMIWGSTDGHDFMLDSSVFGIEETAKIIMELADRKFK